MFQSLKRKFRDMSTIKALLEAAETHAQKDGETAPGAEHLLLAAFDLPDGTARQAFQLLDADPDDFRNAIARQRKKALQSIGVTLDVPQAADMIESADSKGLYDAAPSGQDIMKSLAAHRNDHAPLLGAHIVMEVALSRLGVTARALSEMGLNLDALRGAANAALHDWKAPS